MKVNEADYTWSRHVVTVPVGTTAFEQPVKIYAIKGDGTAWLDFDATTPIDTFPIAVDEITVTGAELKLIGEQGKGVPIESTYLDTTDGMTALEWSSRSDSFALTLPFSFVWNGAEITEITLYAYGGVSMDGSVVGIRIHNRYNYSWGYGYAQPTNGIYYQSGETGDRQFFKIRFDGYSYYSYTTDAYRSIFELFLFSDGTMFLNSIKAPTTCYNRFYLNSAYQNFTVNNGGSAYVLVSSADNGVTWAFETLDGAQRTTLFLVRKDEAICTVADGALVSTDIVDLTAAAFLEHGFATLSDFSPEGEYSVLCWSTGTAPTVRATVTGSPQPQPLTCTVDMSHESIAGIQLLAADYSGTVTLGHRITGGDWTDAIPLSDWVAQDCAALYNSLGDDQLLHLKFWLYGGAKLTRFKITFKN